MLLKEDDKLTKKQILTHYDKVFRGLGEMPRDMRLKLSKPSNRYNIDQEEHQ